MIKKLVATALCMLLLAPSLYGASLDLSIEIPRLQVAEYHRPYIAVWLENDRHQATQLAVWYDLEMADNKGQEWLKDMRQWWRRGGRSLTLPIDGLTGATRSPGSHRLSFPLDSPPLADLPPGEYRLRIEAVREVGGREIVDIPLTWPLDSSLNAALMGSEELGRITLTLTSD